MTLERCSHTIRLPNGGVVVTEQCLLTANHYGGHQYESTSDEVDKLRDAEIMREARRLFLHMTCGWREGRSVMVARSYVEEKIDFAFGATDIWYLRAALDSERLAEFDKVLLEWGSEHGL